MGSAVKFPPLMGPKLPSTPHTPPLSAPAVFTNIDDNSRLREENENLRRELLDRLRGGNKFISGGQFRSGSRGAMQCRACAVSSRAFADAARRLQTEQKQRQRLQEQYEDECATVEALQRSVNLLESKLASEDEDLEEPKTETKEKQPIIAFGGVQDLELEDLKRTLQRLQADNTSCNERNVSLHKELEQQRALATQLGSEIANATSDLHETQDKLELCVQQEVIVRTENGELEARLVEATREKERLEKQLQEAALNAERLAQESLSHQKCVTVTQVQLQTLKDQSQQDLKGIYDSLRQTQSERDKYLEMTTQLETEKSKIEGEVTDLRRKFQAAVHAAGLLSKLEKEKAQAIQRAASAENEKKEAKEAKEELSLRLTAEQEQTTQLQAEVNQLLMERAAINAQLQSMVQLVVVAPSVNVSLGPGQGKICSPGVAAVEGQVADVIEREILPSFMRVFTSNLPSGGQTGQNSAVPNGFVEQLVGDMQRTIGEHLRPVLSQAWKRDKA